MCFKIMMIERPRTPPPSRERILRTLGGSFVFDVPCAPVAGGVETVALSLSDALDTKSLIAGGMLSIVMWPC